ncbi:MAG: hypothetical protein JSU69_11665 [Candidatus Zixiibacteriota bacterium]|nr:MAG: hypothetical protein JSU69_11665 [candidate division Zixibacteria bacterium]
MKYLYLLFLPVTILMPAFAVGQSLFVDKGVDATGIMANVGTTGSENSNEVESVAGVTLGLASKGIIDVGMSIGWLLGSGAESNYGLGGFVTAYPVRQGWLGIPLSAAVGISTAAYGEYKEYSLDFLLSHDLNMALSSFIQPTIGSLFVDFGSEGARGRFHVALPIYFAPHPNATVVISQSASFSEGIPPIYSFGLGLVLGKSKMQVT